jgi:sigma-B regulation protein RsbQ
MLHAIDPFGVLSGAGEGQLDVRARNHVTITGQGQRPMVFAHGYGCDQNMWRFVAPAFEADHTVVLYDHVGAGRSDLAAYDASKYASLEGYATDAIEVCEALGLREVTYVGHSVASMIGVLAANRRPDLFAALVLLGPSPRYINDEGYEGGFREEDIRQLLDLQETNYLGWASALAPVIIGDPSHADATAELEGSFCRTDPAIARRFAAVTFLSDNRADLERVRVPTLIIQSATDAIAGPQVGRYVHEHITESRLVVLPVTGHCAHLTAPELVTEAIREFVAAPVAVR